MDEQAFDRVADWFSSFQGRLIDALETLEPEARFDTKPWQRAAGGGGVMRMLRAGNVIEKGGVHCSDVFGEMPSSLASLSPKMKQGKHFRACGVSAIIHPHNPFAPAAHLNLRHIKLDDETSRLWFGGGCDLTPMLPAYRTSEHEDTVAFHQALEKACAPFPQADYAALKKWCAEYFFLPHRQTERGVGGIFFDDLNSGDAESDFAFAQAVGETFLQIVPALLKKRMSAPFTEAERTQQAKTRGLYAEFNLLYDRGTQFGLKSGGNVESILSSLPPRVIWE